MLRRNTHRTCQSGDWSPIIQRKVFINNELRHGLRIAEPSDFGHGKCPKSGFRTAKSDFWSGQLPLVEGIRALLSDNCACDIYAGFNTRVCKYDYLRQPRAVSDGCPGTNDGVIQSHI